MDAQKWIEEKFLNLRDENYQVTSYLTDEYNCIAWAAHDTERWWWPHPDAYWPTGLPRIATIESFIRAFQTLSYEPCEDGELEVGYEKAAIYVDAQGLPTHMARQLSTGTWTSKLGEAWDIEHKTVWGVEGNAYGKVGRYLKRPLSHSS
jgi:hypothetical protein